MWIDNELYYAELKELIHSYKEIFDELSGKSVFITGGTGLIGQNIINAVMLYNREFGGNIQVISLVRSIDKAKGIFEKMLESCDDYISFVQGDTVNPILYDGPVDFILHGASNTSSKMFVDSPVEVIDTTLEGCKNILVFAKEKQVSSMVFMSTMEVYGNPGKGNKVSENCVGQLSALTVRNCYPISKIMGENLCCAYSKEYGVPVKIARLTQTMGPGVRYDDGRVFAMFARCVIEHKDIVLLTKGETERSYLYVLDAVSALLTMLVKGNAGEAYNIANEDSYCSIAEMAQTVAALGAVEVVFDVKDVSAAGYADTLYMDLDTRKMQSLGWRANTGLQEMYSKMIRYM